MMRRALPLLLALLPLRAEAHVAAAPQAIDTLEGEELALGFEASFGLLWADDGATFRWICHESITAPESIITPRYAHADGVWLGWLLQEGRETDELMYRSVDGCSWDTVEGLRKTRVADAGFHPLDPAIALATSSELIDEPSGIFRSTDAGASWEQVEVAPDSRGFNHLEFARDAGDIAWVSALSYDEAGHWLYRTEDAGATWESLELVFDPPLENSAQMVLLAVSADGAEAYLRLLRDGTSLLYRADAEGTLTELHQSQRVIADAELDEEGGVWFAIWDEGLHHLPAGADSLVHIEAPETLGVGRYDGQLLLATSLDEGYALALSDGAGDFTPIFSFQETAAPPACPAESQVALLCDPLWPQLQAGLWVPQGDDDDDDGDDDDDTGDDDDDDTPPADCAGCSQGRPGHDRPGRPLEAGLMLLGAVLWFGRRRTW